MAFLTEIFFPGGTQPSYKILWKFQWTGGYDKHPPGMKISVGWEGLK